MATGKNGSATVSAPAVVANAAGGTGTAVQSIQARLNEIDTQMSSLTAERQGILDSVRQIGGTVEAAPASTGSRRGRPAGSRNKPKAAAKAVRGTNARTLNGGKTLKVALAEVLRDATGPMSPTEITEAVIKGGYKSNAPNFTTMVTQQLGLLGRTQIGKGMVATHTGHGAWEAGSKTSLNAFIADPSKGNLLPAPAKSAK